MLPTRRCASAQIFVIRLLALLAPLALCFGQTATVNGFVTDTSDAVIVGARLEVQKPRDRAAPRGADQRRRRILVQPAARRALPDHGDACRASAPPTRPELKLDVDQVARIDFKLKPGAVNESVQVTAAAALLDSETSTVGQVISNKNIVELPLNGRNYLNLASLTAGTAPSVGGRTAAEGGFVCRRPARLSGEHHGRRARQ